MMQTAYSRRVRTIVAVGIFQIMTACILFPIGYVFENPDIYRACIVLLLCAVIAFEFRLICWAYRNHFDRGWDYAVLHHKIDKALRQALFDGGFYVEREILMKKCAVLPKLEISLSDTLGHGTIWIENSIKHDHRLEELPISSALPDEFVLESSYLHDYANEYVFEFERFDLNQMVFNTFEDFMRFSEWVGYYSLFLDSRHIFPMFHILLVGQTGSGKSYTLYALILQMLLKSPSWELYIVDPKLSGLYVMGNIICPERVASSVDDTISLLEDFHSRMEERKEEMKEKLAERLDADYSYFNLAPVCLIIDEYSAFNSSLSRYDKKTRDRVNEILGNVVREGRQLGCFLIIAQQQTNATNLPTELKENIPCKIILGSAEKQTYITALGVYPDVAKRHFDVGQGLLAYPAIASPECPAVMTVPTLNFDILQAVNTICQEGASGGNVMTPAPYKVKFL